MKIKKFLLPFILPFLLILETACSIGLGPEVDLEAPEITITSPKNLSNVHLSFVLEGSCKDNSGVTEVIVSNFETGSVYGNATINGEKWDFPINLTKQDEGELTIQVVANDRAGNQSTKSKKVITLIVDDTAPESQEWYIERGKGIFINLYSKTYLESIDTDIVANLDIPQNEEFKIHGKVVDGMSIKSTKVILKDENGKEIISKTEEGTYTPTYTFTHSELVAADSSLVTGKHYFQVCYICEDDHGNKVSDVANWMMWYPESDNPRATQSSEDKKTKTISTLINNTLPIDYFDDDQVKEIKIALKNANSTQLTGVTEESLKSDVSQRDAIFSEANKITANTETTKPEYIYTDTPATGIRNDTHIIPASALQNSATMKLVVCVKDSNDIWNAKIITVFISDGETPLLYITSPLENATPDIRSGTASEFDIVGYTLDKRANPGTVKIMFVPKTQQLNTTEKQDAKAKEIFARDSIVNLISEKTSGNKTDFANDESGIKLYWKKGTNDSKFTDPTNSGWKKRTFTFGFDLLSDFGDDGGKKDKYFAIIYTDANGNENFQHLLLAGDEVPPTITISSPAEDMMVKNPGTETLLLKFNGIKTSGLGMDENTYKIAVVGSTKEYSIENGKLTKSGDYYQINLSSSELKSLNSDVSSQPTFEFSVKDKLGNEAKDRRTIVLSALPKVKSITTDKSEGTYKTGDVLTFQVEFDGEVKVTGTPQLNIYYKSTDTTPIKADYYAGSTTKILSFKFTIPKNTESNGLVVKPNDYLALNGGKIETANVGTGDAIIVNLTQSDITKIEGLKIDAIPPKFTSIKWETDGINKTVKKDAVITATLKAKEPLLISGSPKLKLKAGTGEIVFNFQGLNGDEVEFTHKVTDLTPNGALALNGTAYISSTDASSVKDEAGNELSVVEITKEASSENIVIDTKAPTTTLTVKLNDKALAEGTVEGEQTLSISGQETGATVYYSLNNGSSWLTYDDADKPKINTGDYQICVKQADTAGNEQKASTVVSVKVKAFPSVTALTISNANGNYGAGTNIEFKLSFDDTVTLSSNTAKLIFTNYSGTPVTNYEAKFETASNTKTLTAKYTVKDGDNIQGIKVVSYTPGTDIKDSAELSPTGNIITSEYQKNDLGWRKDVILDGVKPSINENGYSPEKNGVSEHAGTKDDQFVVELTFNENVYKEKGYITLRRIGLDSATNVDKWAIPPVLSNEEFMNIYNQLEAENREILMKTDGGKGEGAEKLQDTTARPVGPYMKYTQGINDDGSPDTTTKFVLAPEYGLFESTDNTVENIRTVLSDVGYHEHKVDINSPQVTISDNVVTITFGDVIEEGQHWALLMEGTCLRDNAQNFVDKLTVTDYNFWSSKVAKPVIRVDRYSHNIGAKEPKLSSAPTNGYQIVSADNAAKKEYIQEITTWNDNGTGWDKLQAGSGAKLEPTGYVKVRIDCETPGAEMKFSLYKDATNNGATSGTQNAPTTAEYNKGKVSNISNKAISTMNSDPEIEYSQNYWIFVGDGSYQSARKDYIAAQASAPTEISMDPSSLGYEGVFKTVVYYHRNDYQYQGEQIQIQGGTFNGGMPSIPGFPLRDAVDGEDSQRYNQNSYVPNKNSANHYWVTYSIVSEYSILSVHGESNWSNAYSYGSYGQISDLENISHY